MSLIIEMERIETLKLIESKEIIEGWPFQTEIEFSDILWLIFL